MTPSERAPVPWVDVYHDIRTYQKNWVPVGFTEFSTTPGANQEIELRIRIRRRGAPEVAR